jgi:hypothetical protein
MKNKLFEIVIKINKNVNNEEVWITIFMILFNKSIFELSFPFFKFSENCFRKIIFIFIKYGLISIRFYGYCQPTSAGFVRCGFLYINLSNWTEVKYIKLPLNFALKPHFHITAVSGWFYFPFLRLYLVLELHLLSIKNVLFQKF